MTADAGKGAKGQSTESSEGGGDKDDRRKKISAAKSPGDEVTVKKTGASASDVEPVDKAEETVIDFAVKKKDGSADTVQDLTLPGKKPATDPTGDAAGSKDRPVSRGWKSDGAKETPNSGESASVSGKTTAMDIPASASGYGGSDSTPDTASSYGRNPAADLEPGPRSVGAKLDKSQGRKAPRKAHLQVARFEPWSVMKFSFIMSLVCFLVLFVAVAVLYLILSGLGVFDALSNTIRDLQGKSNGGLNPASWFSAARILGYTALIGTLNVLLITALATVWSVIYNMAADLVGGVEVTLKEADQ